VVVGALPLAHRAYLQAGCPARRRCRPDAPAVKRRQVRMILAPAPAVIGDGHAFLPLGLTPVPRRSDIVLSRAMPHVKMNSHTPSVNHTQRLFLALWPDDDVRQQFIAHSRLWTWPAGCNPYLPEDWHLTLHFLGPVKTDRVADIVALAAVPFQPFTLMLNLPTCWPQGLAVLCPSQVPPALQALHERLGAALRRLDLPVEARPYQPHVTLARRATGAITPARPTPVVWPARRCVLVESTGTTAPRYRVIQAFE